MLLLYYEILFGLSVLFALVYAYMWHKHFDVNITMLFVLIPISLMAYIALAKAQTIEEAILANKFIYIAGCFTIAFVTLTILELCHLRVPRYVRAIMISFTVLLYLPVLSIGRNGLFYKSAEIATRNGVTMLVEKEYGIMHTFLYIWIFTLFFFCLVSLIYSLIKKNDVSHKIIYLLFLPVVIAMVAFFIGRQITDSIEMMPAAFVFAEFFYLLIVYRLGIYNVDDSGLDSLLEKGGVGFASFDFKLRYLGCNETAEDCLPVLRKLHVDKPIEKEAALADNVVKWIHAFQAKEAGRKVEIEEDGHDGDDLHFHHFNEDKTKNYHVEVNYLYDGRKRRGYQLFMTDDTADMEYLEFQKKFNLVLRDKVDQKTERIREMNDHLILSMANMVESRDPFTGGHIKRTSEGVRLLIEQMKEDPNCELEESFCERVIKAAPMHDLGKIAVRDAVLMKPGRYEPEEYEEMKGHSAHGAKIVQGILDGTDDEQFKKIAINVAHYHHERWDGKGYPEKLEGENIPIEARIMAIADVYDALVSKRVYKEKMPPEKANAIILEGMGTQFDPGLQKYYEAARPKLEAYYASQDAQTKEDAEKT
ncbi:MAG: HD domain-containing protein [Clostridiales bacterium]|nr:HD domain-containing protein [Clostridiales bacterium]